MSHRLIMSHSSRVLFLFPLEWHRPFYAPGNVLLLSEQLLLQPQTFFRKYSLWLINTQLCHSILFRWCVFPAVWQGVYDNMNWHVFFVFLYRIYYWYDERGKKTKCTAPQYVDFVMSLCQKLVTDEEIFPTKYGECPSEGLMTPGSNSCYSAAPCCCFTWIESVTEWWSHTSSIWKKL